MAVVLEIGPAEVRRFGGKAGDPEEVFAALNGIDDPVVLVDESPTETTEVWRALLASLMPSGPAESVRIVYPSWWTRQRVDLVVGATGVPARDVIAVPRRDLIVAGRRSAVVIEIAADLVAVSNGAELEARVRADVMEIVRIAAAWAPRKHPRSYSMHPAAFRGVPRLPRRLPTPSGPIGLPFVGWMWLCWQCRLPSVSIGQNDGGEGSR